ncbi:N-acetylglucosamine-1-phosphodiester alpha-N-acetylglucosaminidase-like isoform X2 [Apostichopus japonicus]|uniref:N-acetylglucosamine-1-phosphodiester alpha-N-acetylglucosaminidase-like isoform X2 n=1 Tax=Stichopus japonicus TaxID=307972 RepID=UPI003AB670A4
MVLSEWRFLIFCFIYLLMTQFVYSVLADDIDLTKYFEKRQLSTHSHRYVRDCQPTKYGNVTHQTQAGQGLLSSTVTLPITQILNFIDEFEGQWGQTETNSGHIAFINNPAQTVSVLEPLRDGGCKMSARTTAVEMAAKHNCLLAVNAGFFNTHTGDCLGNIVSNGRLVRNSHGIQNAHFGIRRDGTLVFGYLSEEDVLDETNPFIQLVGGVGWLIRDGEVYLDESLKAECSDTEETGTMEQFFNVKAARSIVGSDKNGRLVLANVDGRTSSEGVSLKQFANWLLKHDVINAVNLDGGGSSTFVVNGSLVNTPHDLCADKSFRCPRQVSTVICVHEPKCPPSDCSGHGQCILGECHCYGNWVGPHCSMLACGAGNCSGNGRCTEDGCVCEVGFRPPDCREQCLPMTYGQNCGKECLCQNGGYCKPVTGECICMSGYTGDYCEQICPYGTYGLGCSKECDCIGDSCPCHYITGSCALPSNDSFWAPLMSAGQCLARRKIQAQRLVPYLPLEKNVYFILCMLFAALFFVSLVCNIILICFQCACRCKPSNILEKPTRRVYQRIVNLDSSDGL